MSLTVTGVTYYGQPTFTSLVTDINFDTGDLVIGEFAASQFDGVQISNNVIIHGTPSKADIIIVAMNAFDNSFSLKGWQFNGFAENDGGKNVHVIGSSRGDDITGSDQINVLEILEGGPGADTLQGGKADDTFY